MSGHVFQVCQLDCRHCIIQRPHTLLENHALNLAMIASCQKVPDIETFE